jgi:protein TonB
MINYFLPMKIVFVLTALLLSGYCFSQSEPSIRYIDSDGKTVKEKKSVYLIRQQQLKAKSWQVDQYNTQGPLVKTETFSDEQLSIRNGRFSWFDVKGRIDSTGIYKNNQKDKSWYYYKKTDSLQLSKQMDYDKGKLIKVIDYTLKKPEVMDTAGKNAHESEFPGGPQGWMYYLNKVFTYPKRAMEIEAQGTVWVMFLVNKAGKVVDPILYRSVELSIDDEALRVIKATPSWIPATFNGEKLDTYKLQPLTFRLETR